MGFLDRFTGGQGTILLQVGQTQVARGQSVPVSFTLTAQGHLKGRGVHLQVTATEQIHYQAPDMSALNQAIGQAISSRPAPQPGQPTPPPPTLNVPMSQQTKQNQTYQHDDILAAGDFEMQDGETRSYTGTVQIPPMVPPTYNGTDAQHTWTIRAYVDVPMGADVAAEMSIYVV